MKTNNIKLNYSELARLHSCDRRTVKKYDNGYEGKPTTRDKESKLDKYKEKIKSKLEKNKRKYNFCWKPRSWENTFSNSNRNNCRSK